MDELTLAVVGIDHPNAKGGGRRFEAMLCAPGEPVELRPEPKNKHDDNAIAVFSARGVQLGYLAAERAPWIRKRLGAGEDVAAVFQGMVESAAYIRVRFGGGAPTLPAPGARPAAEPPDNKFFADPDGPDWGA